MARRYDYRTQYKNMSKEDLEKARINLKSRFDDWFCRACGEETAEKIYRELAHVERKLGIRE